MKLRRWLPPVLLLSLLMGVAVFPATPNGRAWLLEQAGGYLEEAGYRVSYTSHSGSLWNGVTLEGVSVTGQGLDVTAERARLGYFLPALLTGELPVSLDLATVRGKVSFEELGQAPSGGGNPPVSIELRELDVTDVAVGIEDVPWTMPAMSLSDVEVSRLEEELRFKGMISTSEGSATIQGRMRLDPWRLELDIEEASATLARHWWPHVSAGTLIGTIHADAESLTGDFALADAEVAYAGLAATGTSGAITLDGTLVEAFLEADRALGGPAEATVTVNAGARTWQAEVDAEPGIADLLDWIAGSQGVAETLAVEGSATTSFTASGWESVSITGQGTGAGALLGLPVEVLRTEYRFESATGIELALAGFVAGGRLEFDARPEADALLLSGRIIDARPLPELTADASFEARGTAEGIDGRVFLTGQGQLAERDITFEGDARLDSDGLQLFATAQDSLGAVAEGAAVLRDGNVDGRVNIGNLGLPPLEGTVDLTVRGDGPLDRLPLLMEVAGPALDHPSAGPVQLDASFAGEITATLAGTTLEGVEGRLGPALISGSLDLARADGRLVAEFQPLLVASPVEMPTSGGRIELGLVDGTAAVSGQFAVDSLSGYGLRTEAQLLGITLEPGARAHFTLRDGRSDRVTASGTWDQEGLEATVASPPLTLSGEDVEVVGRVALPSTGAPRADIQVSSRGLAMQVTPSDGGHDLVLHAEAGQGFGPLTLQQPLAAQGRIAHDLRAGNLRAQIEGMDVDLRVRDTETGLRLEATLAAEGESMELAWVPSREGMLISGSLDIDRLARAFGVPVSGTVAGQLTHGVQGFSGQLNLTGNVQGVEADLDLLGVEDSIQVSGDIEAAGSTWQVSGTALPGVELEARSEWGRLNLIGTDVLGQGEVPAQIGPLQLAERTWRLGADLTSATATVELGRSQAVLDWRDGLELASRLDFDAQVDPMALLGGQGWQPSELPPVPVAVDGQLDWSAEGEGNLAGEIRLLNGTLVLSGDPNEAVRIEGTFDAAPLLASTLPGAGESMPLHLDSRVSMPGAERVEASLRLDLPEAEVTANIAREATGWNVEAATAGLAASWNEQAMAVTAQEANLDWLTKLLGLDLAGSVTADGELTRSEASWDGTLSLTGQAPTARFQLTGAGTDLLLDGTVAGEQFSGRARGRLLPEADLAIEAQALGGQVSADGRLIGLTEAALEGEVRFAGAAAGPLEIPARTYRLSGGSSGTPSLTLSGVGTDLSLSSTGYAGVFRLPVRIDGVEHELAAEITGELTAPEAHLELSGDLVQASGRLEGTELTALATADVSSLLPEPLLATGPARIDLSLDGTSWTAVAELPVELLGEPAIASLDTSGDGLAYSGRFVVENGGGDLLAGTVVGQADQLTAQVELDDTAPEALARHLPAEVDATVSGTVSYRTDDNVLDVDVLLEGTGLGEQFRFAFEGAYPGNLSISGHAAGHAVDASLQGRDASFAIASFEGGPILDGTLSWHDAVSLRAGGQLRGHELAAAADFVPTLEGGDLEIAWGTAGLRASVERGPGGALTLETYLDHPGDGPLGISLAGEAVLEGAGSVWAVDRLVMASEGPAGEVTAQLAGTLAPGLSLIGTARLAPPGTEPLTYALEVSGDGLMPEEIGVAREGLSLTARPLDERPSLRLSGDGEPFPGVSIVGDLGWTGASGFSGRAAIRLEDSGATASLVGDGGLDVEVGLPGTPAPVVNGRLQLTSNPLRDPSLEGHFAIEADLGTLAADLPPGTLVTQGTLQLGGELTRPRLSGPVALSGEIEAAGAVELDLTGGTISLAGPDLELEALVDGGHLELSGSTSVDLARLGLPLLDSGTLSGTVRGSGDLASLGEAALDGQFRLADVSIAGTGATATGEVAIGGVLAAPRLEASLLAGGEASGRILASFDVSEEQLELTADLTWRDLSLLADIEARGPDATASGRLELPGGSFGISSGAPPPILAEMIGARQVLLLDGEGGFGGVDVAIDPFAPALAAIGDMGPLVAGASGDFQLTAAADESGNVELSGSARDLAWQRIEIGDVRLTSEPETGMLVVSGERLEMSVQQATLEWQIQQLALTPLAGLEVRASGAGTGLAGTVDIMTAGSLLGEPAVLQGSLGGSAEDGIRLSAVGELAGGALDVDAGLGPAGWDGVVSLEDARLGPAQAAFRAELTGKAAAPVVTVSGSVETETMQAEVMAELSTDDQVAEAIFRSTQLDTPVAVRLVAGEGTAQLELSDLGERSLVVARGADGSISTGGAIAAALGPVSIELAANEAGESVDVAVAVSEFPGLRAVAELPGEWLTRPSTFADRPVEFTGQDALSGTVALSLSPLGVQVTSLAYASDSLQFRLSGSLDSALSGTLSGEFAAPLPTVGDVMPGLPGQVAMDFELEARSGTLTLAAEGELGSLTAEFEPGTGRAGLDAELALGEGSAVVRLDYRPAEGPAGTITAQALPVSLFGSGEPMLLSANLDLSEESLSGDAELRGPQGVASATGSLGLAHLLPTGVAPLGTLVRTLDLRLGAFELALVPGVSEQAPFLSAPLSGFLQVRDSAVVGRLASPDLTIAGENLPVTVDATGSTTELILDAVVAGSPIRLTVSPAGFTALATLDRFPLHRVAEAITGPTDVEAEVTGVARLASSREGSSGLRVEVATEMIRLERGGVVTTGNVSLVLADGRLQVNEANFSGAGNWQASGSIGQERLDLSLVAEDADFTPLLGLVPVLAEYGVAASGSLTLSTSGSLAEPVVAADTAGLRLEVAGAGFRLDSATARLEGEQLRIDADIESLSPVPGRLVLSGGGALTLTPEVELTGLRFDLQGDARVPWLGHVTGLDAAVTSRPDEGGALWLEGEGLLGNPFSLTGSLVPLDLRLSGTDLRPELPQLLLAQAQVDADVRLTWEDVPTIGGQVLVDDALFALGTAREEQPAPPVAEGEGEPVPTTGANQGVPFRFDNISIDAPARVRFSENFGSAEAALDLTLGGTSNQPALSGTAQVLRGTLRFSGREFTIRSAAARFDPSRGVLPILDVVAVTSFDTSRVVEANNGVRFVAPADGGRFEVLLSFTAEVQPAPGQSPPIRLDISPRLSSEALIQISREDGTATAPRSLSESELLSLITLGRLELNAPLAGQAGLATAVAEGAIDTAVDLLFVSELQSALAEALGLDLVEIETTALSQVLGRAPDDPFSVSLRLGGYLSDEVFASYRIGTFDDVQGLYALTNEVNLVYDIGLLELDLAGRINFSEAGATAPSTELSASLRYDLYGPTGLEAGVDLSSERQQVRFGVTIRW